MNEYKTPTLGAGRATSAGGTNGTAPHFRSPEHLKDYVQANPELSPSVTAQALAVISENLATDALTRFRTTWMRAVAHAWIEPEYRALLLRKPKEALARVGLTEWPWEGTLELVVNPEDEFRWIGDDWIWPADKAREEGLTLVVPLTAPDAAKDKHAVALADYYARRPSLLSAGPSSMLSSVMNVAAFNFNPAFAGVIHATTRNAAGGSAMTIAGNAFPANGFMPTPGSFLDFQVALLSVMAKSWENENFRVAIQNKENVNLALATVRGYSAPWKLNLIIAEDKAAEWNENEGWTKLSPHVLELHLPVAPDNKSEHSIALATYNSTGSQYFATCCG